MAIHPKPIALDKLLRMREDLVVEPIVDNPTLKPMPDAPEPPRRIGGKVLLMDGGEVPAAAGGKMKAVPIKPPVGAGEPKQDQVEPVLEPPDASGSVRLRLRINRGQVTVVGARSVPGAVPVPERLDYGLAYEIMIGARRVAMGSIPDVGTRRSFPDPEGRPGLEGHSLTELESFEVNVRVSQKEFSETALPKLRVTLFRMKGQPPAVAITAAPLVEQFPDQLRPVAELRGIDLKQLPSALRGQVRAAMKTTRSTRRR